MRLALLTPRSMLTHLGVGGRFGPGPWSVPPVDDRTPKSFRKARPKLSTWLLVLRNLIPPKAFAGEVLYSNYTVLYHIIPHYIALFLR